MTLNMRMRRSRSMAKLPMEFLVNTLLYFIKSTLLRIAVLRDPHLLNTVYFFFILSEKKNNTHKRTNSTKVPHHDIEQ